MRISKILMMIAAAGTLTISVTAPASARQGQDTGVSGSQCARKDSAGKTEASGNCGTVCKDKDIKTATGEDQASGYSYTCTAARVIVHGGLTAGNFGTLTVHQTPKTPSGFSIAPNVVRNAR